MSLRRIVLRDFVIVRSLDLELGAGFCVLTGETGAGKSILIDALQLALGGRSDSAVVREGTSRCEVAAEFDLPASQRSWLQEQGFSDDDDVLLLRRTVDAEGRSRAWINGSPATLTQLRALADGLVDIHGQHAWQSLTRTDAVRTLLDATPALTCVSPVRPGRWRQARKALDEARERQSQLQQEGERLSWQIGELDKLAPAEGEWEELNTQHARLANAQSLIDARNLAVDALDEAEPSASALLHRALQALAGPGRIWNPALRPPSRPWRPRRPRSRTRCMACTSAWVTPSSIPKGWRCWTNAWACGCHWRAATDGPRRNWPPCWPSGNVNWPMWTMRWTWPHCSPTNDKAWQVFERECQSLTVSAARRLPGCRPRSPRSCSRSACRVAVSRSDLQTLAEPQAHGMEQVEFLVAGHAGVSPRPVGKVASGGELSRIALAISVVTSRLGQAPTLIFDEVDSGIGGAVAHTVGRLLRQLGADRQVLAVTHLPQVAACGDRHLLVRKQQATDGTFSEVLPIEAEARVTELARMLGGGERSEVSLAHARELLTA
jgi:DNA repair protein RecN (Recombination protein N)